MRACLQTQTPSEISKTVQVDWELILSATTLLNYISLFSLIWVGVSACILSGMQFKENEMHSMIRDGVRVSWVGVVSQPSLLGIFNTKILLRSQNNNTLDADIKLMFHALFCLSFCHTHSQDKDLVKVCCLQWGIVSNIISFLVICYFSKRSFVAKCVHFGD